MDRDELVANARVVALPMRERFRGITVREALLIDGGDGRWAEWSPFTEYDDAEASTWLRAALAELTPSRPQSERSASRSLSERSETKGPPPAIRVNATVPAIPAAAVPALLDRFPGVRTAKVKVAERGQSLADDLARVAAVRAALGPAGRIRVDANALWSLDEAETALRALADFDLEYAEQPVASIQDMVALRSRLHPLVRIAADELVRKPEDPLAVARAGAADLLILKLQPLGGAARALDILAEAGLPAVTSSALETSVGLAAAARFAAMVNARQPDVDFDHGLGTAALFAADVTADPLLPVDGAIPLREVRPDAELLDRYAAAPERRDWWLARLRRCITLLDAG